MEHVQLQVRESLGYSGLNKENSGDRWYWFSTPAKAGLLSLIPFGLPLIACYFMVRDGCCASRNRGCVQGRKVWRLGGRRAKPADDFYHEVSPFSKSCFLFCPPAYFYLGDLGPNQLLPPLAAKKAKMVGNRIVIISRPFIAHLRDWHTTS